MGAGGKFNYKVEKDAENTINLLINKQFEAAFVLANKNLKKKNKHPIFIFAKSIEFLAAENQEAFQKQFSSISDLKTVRQTDYYNFGVFFQSFKYDILAIECFDKCITLDEKFIEGHEQLANSIFNIGEYESALGAYISALELNPDNKQFIMKAAICCANIGQYTKALEFYEKLIVDSPFNSDIRVGISRCLLELGQVEKAEAAVSNDIENASEPYKDYLALSIIYNRRNDMESGLRIAAKGYKEYPNYLPLIKLYGALLTRLGYSEQALDVLKVALARDSDDSETIFNYGNAYQNLGQLSQAREYFTKALELKPDYHKAYNNLGVGYQAQGDHDKATICYQAALELAPNRDDYHSNILFSLLHMENDDPKVHFDEARRWQEQHCAKLNEVIHEYEVDKSLDAKIRIGYISADFGDHVVSYHWMPIAEHHDRSKYEIYLYSQRTHTGERSAAINKKIDSLCDRRRDVSLLSNKELCDQIVEDKINILIDLSGHTSGNRLAALSFKPAPVQATFIGYPATTGLDAIDYFITQPMHVPLESSNVFSEKLAYIPGCTSYNVREDARSVLSKELPYKENGYVTFGSFNRPNKVSVECIQAWAHILRNVPNSRFLIKGDDIIGSHYEEIITEYMEKENVSSERLIFRGRNDYPDYLKEMNEIDIGLDSFPFNGATTSFDMLFMGRGYISLKGKGAIQNIVGSSYLEYFGHPELVATSVHEYKEKAIQVAGNLDSMESIRLELREMFLKNVSDNGLVVCQGLENACDIMWETYVEGKPKEHISTI
ncbi:tetratricopeptide repeat protein [Kiloniella majae]|uniref:tetratricopeptide repeat protein n=1 Tax=Kiloniella majae TaxID=1938558 RepID=UPI000A277600|nr:tetratricopeptide repeat protein [Kiloniella majae]